MEKEKFKAKLNREQAGKTYLFAGIGVLCLMVLVGVLFDYYYCLNDDAVMRDILCGSYTGVPEGRNIQMLYPLSALISLLYRLFPTFFGIFDIPWYGLFLCGCQYGALFLIAARAAGFAHTTKMKTALVALTLISGGSILLYELIFVQYTMTCGILMAAAVFWFYTTKETADVKAFLKENTVSVLLVVLAFCIRTEMAILLFPYLCGAGLCKWSKEEVIFTKKNAVKYGSLIGAALVLMGASVLLNRAAYGSEEWQRFHLFFDYRTEIYDFLGYPEYETNQSFYEKAGLQKAEAVLIDNYNFALDENIDENVLREMVEYQTKQRGGKTLCLIPTGEALWIYRHSLFAAEYMPFNGLVVLLYLLVAATAFFNRDKSYFIKIPMFIGIRTVCWLYIIFRNRTPDRITHGLFFVELLLLFSLFVTEWKKKRTSCITASAIACIILVLSLPGLFSRAWTEQEQREKINGEWILLQEYCKEHSENFYVIDVYSTVDYSEKMFERVDNSYRNYDLCGGWSAKSPLYEKKLAQRNIGNLEQALAEKEHVFFVSKVSRGIEWLEEYYEQKENPHTPEIVDEIGLNGEVRFVIYKLL